MKMRVAGIPLTLSAAALLVLAPAAQAQQFGSWLVSEAFPCGLITNNQLQDIPVMGLGLNGDGPGEIEINVMGSISFNGEPQSGEVVFAERRVTATNLQFGTMDEPDIYGIVWEIPSEYLVDLAQSDSILLRVDGQDFTTLTLAERAPAVAWLARCLRNSRG